MSSKAAHRPAAEGSPIPRNRRPRFRPVIGLPGIGSDGKSQGTLCSFDISPATRSLDSMESSFRNRLAVTQR